MQNKHKHIKWFLALILSAAMVITCLSVNMTAFATNGENQSVDTAAQEQNDKEETASETDTVQPEENGTSQAPSAAGEEPAPAENETAGANEETTEEENVSPLQEGSNDTAPALNAGKMSAPAKDAANNANNDALPQGQDSDSEQNAEPVTYSGIMYGRHIAWDLNYPGTRPKDLDELTAMYSVTEPLENYALAFEDQTDEDGKVREGVFKKYADSMRGAHKVTNKASGNEWTIVGFIPINSYDVSYKISAKQVQKYYTFESMEAAEKYVKSNNGVLYGDAPTADLLTAASGNIVTVWYEKNTYAEEYPKVTTTVNPITDRKAVDYKETSDVLVKKVTTKKTHYGVEITYDVEIPTNTDVDEININTLDFPLTEEDQKNLQGLQPGDKVQYYINVTDKSGAYVYKKNSGAIGTIPLQAEDGKPYFEGFEKYKIPQDAGEKSLYCRRNFNKPLQNLLQSDYPKGWWDQFDYLFELVGNGNVEKGFIECVGDSLLSKGYGNKEDYQTGTDSRGNPVYDNAKVATDWLDKYYLDWFAYNFNNGKAYTSFSELPKSALSVLFQGEVNIQTTETNDNVANALYYAFYEYGYPAEETGVYTWMNKPGDYENADGNMFNEHLYPQWKDSEEKGADGKTIIHKMSYRHVIDGEFNSNGMEQTKFGTGVQIKLVKPELRITKILKGYAEIEKGAENVNATVAFRIRAYKAEDTARTTPIYENYVGLAFDGDGTKTAVVKGIPGDAVFVVTEVYGGNYEPDRKEVVLTEKDNLKIIDGKQVWTVTFENTRNGNTLSSGVINKYRHDKDGSQVVTQETVSPEDK